MVDESAMILDGKIAEKMNIQETWDQELRPQNGDVVKIVAVQPEGYGVVILPPSFYVAFSTDALNVNKEDLRAVTMS